MDAGIELDKLIEEKIFNKIKPLSEAADYQEFKRIEGHWPPPYSTEIEEAWKVVEKLDLLKDRYLSKSGDRFSICEEHEYLDLGQWETRKNYLSNGDTVPHTICLAALKVIDEPQR